MVPPTLYYLNYSAPSYRLNTGIHVPQHASLISHLAQPRLPSPESTSPMPKPDSERNTLAIFIINFCPYINQPAQPSSSCQTTPLSPYIPALPQHRTACTSMQLIQIPQPKLYTHAFPTKPLHSVYTQMQHKPHHPACEYTQLFLNHAGMFFVTLTKSAIF